MLILKNAKIYTMAGARYDKGYVTCDGVKLLPSDPWRIARSGKDDQEIDAAGMVLMPGLVDAHCHIGMVEDAMGFEG